MNDNIKLILLMMIVTYIPRLIPFLIVSTENLPKGVLRFLKLVPYAALGALIIPGVFSATSEKPIAGLIGVGFAMLYAWHKGGIIIPVIGSIFITLAIFMI